jgi:hypothetical protein
MTLARSSSLLGVALLLIGATSGCNTTGSLQRPAGAAQRVAALHTPAEPEPIELSFSFTGGDASDAVPEDETDLTFGAEGTTLIAVDQDTVGDASGILHFTAARRGQETIGVRVFFEVGNEDGDDDTYLGLRRADRIEEIDGLTIGALSSFLEAWQSVGSRPEVRLLLNRAGRSHTVIYRRRLPGTARRY